MLDFFGRLFDTSDFPARWHCGHWSEGHGWLHVISDTLIFGAYAAIPIAIVTVAWRRRTELEFTPLYWLFAGFIFSCGFGHLIEATIFWQPWYRFSGLVKALTAVVSWATVVAVVRYAPAALALPAVSRLNAELAKEIEERRRVEARAHELNQQLEARVQELETLLEVLPIGIGIALDPSCRSIRSNRSFARLLGLQEGANASLSAPVGEAPNTFKVYSQGRELLPDDLPIQRAAREGKIVRDFEEVLVRSDGVRVDLLCQAAPILDEAHRCRGAVGVFHDITERKAAEARLLSSLQEKQVLLHEVHHRVKNNLQFIISLLRLQSAEITDPKVLELIEEMRCRVHAMALVHEKLYRADDLSRLDYASYLRDLVAGVFRTMSKRVTHVNCTVEASPEELETSAAVPVGFIVNELVSNALKHAFGDGEGGLLSIRLQGNPAAGYELIVRDNGRGLPPNFDVTRAESMGLRLVVMLVRQLGGVLNMGGSPGAEFRITFGSQGNS